MTDQLEFDGDTGARLERLYHSRDVRHRRQLATDGLSPLPGHIVADVGCGPGFHTSELADQVGAAGTVIGIDRSDEMIEMARARNATRPNVEFRPGDATRLPLPDTTVDGLVAVQVLEYVGDTATAVEEAYRVLKPQGRLVILDIDWATVSWQSDDPERMSRVLAAWDQHLAHPSLPGRLPHLLAATGFTDVRLAAHPFVNTSLDQDAYSSGLVPLIHSFVSAHGIPAAEADAWMAELSGLDESGRYFFSVTAFTVVASKPGPVPGDP